MGVLAVFSSLWLTHCASLHPPITPAIEFTKVPPSRTGDPEAFFPIEGRAVGLKTGQRIVLYARSGLWWVQPTVADPFTRVQADSTWKSKIHPGNVYAALLVNAGYRPQARIEVLPNKGGAVEAVAITEGPRALRVSGQTLPFDGYDWDVRRIPNYPVGVRNDYDPRNVWTDRFGLLHLQVELRSGRLTSAEVSLPRSLGYGTYRFVVRGVPKLDPSLVFTMLTSDNDDPFREMDIQISKWGGTAVRNGEFVIQPYYIPANTTGFQSPDGIATFMLRWVPGRAHFKVFRGRTSNWESRSVAEHLFTSGVPSPGDESIHMDLYVASTRSSPLLGGTEVIIENFDYLP